mmetsp:Transcript_84975/g.263096  ORF Transcript_84975/g.263096 Transcript_84975/m.263096 type:complete len:258 (+) Transcript_84975:537-1310(+)
MPPRVAGAPGPAAPPPRRPLAHPPPGIGTRALPWARGAPAGRGASPPARRCPRAPRASAAGRPPAPRRLRRPRRPKRPPRRRPRERPPAARGPSGTCGGRALRGAPWVRHAGPTARTRRAMCPDPDAAASPAGIQRGCCPRPETEGRSLPPARPASESTAARRPHPPRLPRPPQRPRPRSCTCPRHRWPLRAQPAPHPTPLQWLGQGRARPRLRGAAGGTTGAAAASADRGGKIPSRRASCRASLARRAPSSWHVRG